MAKQPKLPDKARLFDALFDTDEFAATLADVAAIIGARSFVGGFAYHDGSRALDIADDYYGPDVLAQYYADYFDQDPWSLAVRARWKPGIMADPGEVLTNRDIEWSGLYQELLRPIGDDMHYTLAVTAETPHGIGSIGFHRGRSRVGYSDKDKDILASVTPDLAKILSLRGRIQGLERDVVTRSSALDALSDGMVILDGKGRVLMANAAAEVRLAAGDLLRLDKGRLDCLSARHRKDLADTLAALPHLRHTALRLEVDHGPGLDLTFLALPPGGLARTLVSFPAERQASRADILRRIYALSPGEAEIAIMLADGLDPADIAEARRTSINTVRVQLRAIGEKLGCSRLIDIVRRVAALPRLRDLPAA